MHPSQKILNTVEQLLQQAMSGWNVYVHRTDSLSEAEYEMPAAIVSLGPDVPLQSLNTMSQLGSALTIGVSLIDQGDEEKALIKRLTDQRLVVHRTIMPPGTVAKSTDLPWAMEVGYLGADKPQEANRGELYAKALQTNWQVAYQMDRFNPDVS